MPSKQNAEIRASKAAGCLDSFEVVLIEGNDAGDFLQRQTMNDLRELDAVGAWQWNGLLSAKGRVLSLFALLRSGERQYRLLLPDGDSSHWADTLRRYVFRNKLTIEALPDARAFGLIEVEWPDAPTVANRATAVGEGWLLDFSGALARRTLAIDATLPPEITESLAVLPPAEPAWAREDLRHGLPRIPQARRDSHTPQMLGLDRLRAYSVKKGCYPGQEIVARTHFLGQAKRSLQRLVSDRPFGDSVRCGDASVALFDRLDFDRHHEALAVFADSVSPCTHDDGHAVERQPFCAGLARGGA